VTNAPVADAFLRHVHTRNTGDLSEFDRVIAADYLGHVAAGARDRDGLRSRLAPFRAPYPDVVFNVEDQLVSGEKVVTRLRARATSAVDGAPKEMIGINISRVAEGRIAEE
jgi:ketosteroid isomerase-like protein